MLADSLELVRTLMGAGSVAVRGHSLGSEVPSVASVTHLLQLAWCPLPQPGGTLAQLHSLCTAAVPSTSPAEFRAPLLLEESQELAWAFHFARESPQGITPKLLE